MINVSSYRYKCGNLIVNANRIMIIGPPGSGKTFLAHYLHNTLHLPLHHLDRYCWLPQWKPVPQEKIKSFHQVLMRQKKWIIDGNHLAYMSDRMQAADLIIMLDMPVAICMWRIIKRWFLMHKKQRLDLAEGCFDCLSLRFLLHTAFFKRRYYKKIIAILEETKKIFPDKIYIKISTLKEINTFINNILKRHKKIYFKKK